MDDSCAVCADPLEWVAYGSCGHREVCSTCVARLRFIIGDRCCCICKTECPVVFFTKALGDYTRMINDFTLFPSEPKEGRVGKYWYHEDTQAFFDDVDHYKMIKAMCRLSCSVCDKNDEEQNVGSRRRERFRNIEQLKGHLYHQHWLRMCSLCLEGRKVFICEQKLYSRAQLNQHIKTGDSEVDGSESERGGFMGHPMCEFCKSPFYGDNELYTHMSMDHYTCDICQRQHPGRYEYYKNYDDLEIHFRQEHFLCEDEACLAKKFVVFQSEAEMKRHNTIEHGGRMSRSKRNAALQIPTSFRFRRGSDQDHRRGRGRTFRRDQSDDQLSMAIQASLETTNSEGSSHDPSSSSSARVISDHVDGNDIDSLIQPLELLTPTDSEASTRYLQALGQSSRNAPLQESSFPPLPMGSSSNQQNTRYEQDNLPKNTMAAHLRRQNNKYAAFHNSLRVRTATSSGRVVSRSTQHWPTINNAPLTTQSSAVGPVLPSYASSTQSLAQPTAVHGHISVGSPGNLSNTNGIRHSASDPNLAESGSLKPSSSDFPPVSAAQIRRMPLNLTDGGSSKTSSSDFPPVSATKIRRTPPNLESGSLKSSSSDFPPVSATQVHRTPTGSHVLPKVEDVHTANKSLVEKMRAALEYDEDKYDSFKDISGRYRQGSIDTEEYLYHAQQYGLSHLVLELARLCPDAKKQKELVESYNANLRSNGQKENGWQLDSTNLKDSNSKGSKKGKAIVAESGSTKDGLADSFISTVRALQSNSKPQEEDVVLSKDGYRGAKGKASVTIDEQQVELRSQNDSASTGDGSNRKVRDGGGGNKQRKKTSKFHRVRLGNGLMAATLDLNNSNPDPDPDPSPLDDRLDGGNSPPGVLPVRGVWRKGGGQKLFS